MTLALYSDANEWLDGTKIQFLNAFDAAPEATSVDNIVRAYLKDTFPDNVDLWDANPGTGQEATPAIIREIASLLMAAYRYEKVYSLDLTAGPTYASVLEARAMALIEGIKAGTITLIDTTYDAPHFDQGNFYPNDMTIVTDDMDSEHLHLDVGDPLRFFTMDRVF